MPDARRTWIDRIALPDDGVGVHHHPHVQGDAAVVALQRHDVLEIGFCHQGGGTFIIEDKALPFHAGCAVVISEHEYHLAASTAGTTSRWDFCYLDPARLLAGWPLPARLLASDDLRGPRFANVLEPGRAGACCDLVRLLLSELAGRQPGRADTVRGLVVALLALLRRLPGRSAGPAPTAARPLARIAPAIELVCQHYGEPLSARRLAAVCRLSPAMLRRHFQTAVGCPPLEYLARHRVAQAATLLRSNERPVTEIAFAVGFTSLSAFNRRFRAAFGRSPRAWRARAP